MDGSARLRGSAAGANVAAKTGVIGLADVTVVLCRTDGEDRARSHALLRDSVAHALDIAPELVILDRDTAGRPVVSGPGPLHVSLSHTVGAAAVAFSRKAPVGVDIEPVHEVRAVDMARRWFTPDEADWIAELCEEQRSAAFLRLWTYKEAIGKARGRGLSGGGLRQPVPRHVDADGVPRQVAEAWVAALSAPTGFVLSVACLSERSMTVRLTEL
ncbi:MAG: 4'-phosphopantetheinyl transferase superfamily protein [Actinomycetota bacterium]|nr:4'-phosphopantetheinyl transferase superfamily protein [Actinomycetota bacterium]